MRLRWSMGTGDVDISSTFPMLSTPLSYAVFMKLFPLHGHIYATGMKCSINKSTLLARDPKQYSWHRFYEVCVYMKAFWYPQCCCRHPNSHRNVLGQLPMAQLPGFGHGLHHCWCLLGQTKAVSPAYAIQHFLPVFQMSAFPCAWYSCLSAIALWIWTVCAAERGICSLYVFHYQLVKDYLYRIKVWR